MIGFLRFLSALKFENELLHFSAQIDIVRILNEELNVIDWVKWSEKKRNQESKRARKMSERIDK